MVPSSRPDAPAAAISRGSEESSSTSSGDSTSPGEGLKPVWPARRHPRNEEFAAVVRRRFGRRTRRLTVLAEPPMVERPSQPVPLHLVAKVRRSPPPDVEQDSGSRPCSEDGTPRSSSRRRSATCSGDATAPCETGRRSSSPEGVDRRTQPSQGIRSAQVSRHERIRVASGSSRCTTLRRINSP